MTSWQGKGGASKSTSAVNIIGALRELGFKACVFDYDKEKPDAYNIWSKHGEKIDWIYFDNADKGLASSIDELSINHEVIYIDSSPNYSPNAFEALIIADLVIIPTSPDPLEKENAMKCVAGPQLAKKPWRFLLNKVDKSTKVGKEIITDAGNEGVTFSNVITKRAVVSQCPDAGKWVGDFARNSDSHKQFLSLGKEVISWAKDNNLEAKISTTVLEEA